MEIKRFFSQQKSGFFLNKTDLEVEDGTERARVLGKILGRPQNFPQIQSGGGEK